MCFQVEVETEASTEPTAGPVERQQNGALTGHAADIIDAPLLLRLDDAAPPQEVAATATEGEAGKEDNVLLDAPLPEDSAEEVEKAVDAGEEEAVRRTAAAAAAAPSLGAALPIGMVVVVQLPAAPESAHSNSCLVASRKQRERDRQAVRPYNPWSYPLPLWRPTGGPAPIPRPRAHPSQRARARALCLYIARPKSCILSDVPLLCHTQISRYTAWLCHSAPRVG